MPAWTLHPSQLGGTRHLSAAQFVYDQRDASALVASQDGRFTIFQWSPCEEHGPRPPRRSAAGMTITRSRFLKIRPLSRPKEGLFRCPEILIGISLPPFSPLNSGSIIFSSRLLNPVIVSEIFASMNSVPLKSIASGLMRVRARRGGRPTPGTSNATEGMVRTPLASLNEPAKSEVTGAAGCFDTMPRLRWLRPSIFF